MHTVILFMKTINEIQNIYNTKNLFNRKESRIKS